MIEGIRSMSGQLQAAVQAVVANAMQAAAGAMMENGGINAALAGVEAVTGTSSLPASTYGNEGYGPGYAVDYRRMGQEMANAMDGVSVNMDGKNVGNIVSEPVNDNLGNRGRMEGRDME